jgi:hypothetical protein
MLNQSPRASASFSGKVNIQYILNNTTLRPVHIFCTSIWTGKHKTRGGSCTYRGLSRYFLLLRFFSIVEPAFSTAGRSSSSSESNAKPCKVPASHTKDEPFTPRKTPQFYIHVAPYKLLPNLRPAHK